MPVNRCSLHWPFPKDLLDSSDIPAGKQCLRADGGWADRPSIGLHAVRGIVGIGRPEAGSEKQADGILQGEVAE